jgi:hypothetical protein
MTTLVVFTNHKLCRPTVNNPCHTTEGMTVLVMQKKRLLMLACPMVPVAMPSVAVVAVREQMLLSSALLVPRQGWWVPPSTTKAVVMLAAAVVAAAEVR